MDAFVDTATFPVTLDRCAAVINGLIRMTHVRLSLGGWVPSRGAAGGRRVV